MEIQYVVSIEGALLYFDAQRQRLPDPEIDPGNPAKLHLALILPELHPASSAEWNDVLSDYTAEQRRSAEISQAISPAAP